MLAGLAQRALQWMLGIIGYMVYLRMRPPTVTAKEPERATAETTR